MKLEINYTKWKIHTYGKIKQHVTQQPMDQRINPKKNLKNTQRQMKMEI